MSSSVIEKELTCSICTDTLYDPVTFLDCLHTNCGACAKSWFASLESAANSAAEGSLGSTPKYTCPVCRAIVRAAKPNATLQSLLGEFVSKDPSKDRSSEEKKSMRCVYRPGGAVLPGEVGSALGSGGVVEIRTPIQTPILPLQTPVLPLQIPTRPLRGRPSPLTLSSSSGSAVRVQIPSPRNPFSGVRSPGTLSSTLFINYFRLSTAQTAACCHCNKRLDYAVRGICTTCKLVTCTHCFRSNKGCRSPCATGHIILFQKLYMEPTIRIEVGLFCAICESFCGEDPQGPSSFFWQCSECRTADGEEWGYCSPCVQKGNCCSHDLELYRKQPNSSQPSAASALITQMGDFAQQVRSDPAADTPAARLGARGYARVVWYPITCDNCGNHIPTEHSFLHCTLCSSGQWNTCMGCYTTLHVVAGEDGDSFDNFKCPSGHPLHLLTDGGEPGTLKTILPAPHPPPDVFRSSRPLATAVAIKGNYSGSENDSAGSISRPDSPGVRMWDSGDRLSFPEGAKILDVCIAFSEGSGADRVEFYWGWYAGAGGLFPGELVSIED